MIEKLWKYIQVLYKGIIGVVIELIYPLIVFSTAAIISFVVYLIILIKK